jgi:hypothetical protein
MDKFLRIFNSSDGRFITHISFSIDFVSLIRIISGSKSYIPIIVYSLLLNVICILKCVFFGIGLLSCIIYTSCILAVRYVLHFWLRWVFVLYFLRSLVIGLNFYLLFFNKFLNRKIIIRTTIIIVNASDSMDVAGGLLLSSQP